MNRLDDNNLLGCLCGVVRRTDVREKWRQKESLQFAKSAAKST